MSALTAETVFRAYKRGYAEGVRQGTARERARLRRLFVVAMRRANAETARAVVVADLIKAIRTAPRRRRR